MNIHGFNKLTLLDYPEHLGATIFLGSCNFRCPFCQNAGLVLNPAGEPTIPTEEVLAHLRKRFGILEGVCITGGEPTLSADLTDFIRKIKAIGYLVKLDTNGTNPTLIRTLHEEGLLDYVAMDIKSSKEHYAQAAGLASVDMDAISQSVDYLMHSGIDYEFRTTVVKEIHDTEDFVSIGEWIGGCKRYFLQAYRDSEHIIAPGYHAHTEEKMQEFQTLLQEKIPLVELRGI